jgi:hypothetical protein
MKNIHLLPTDKPSRLFKFANQLHLDTIPKEYYKKYHIYITSDEEIKEGDWGLSKLNEVILFGRSYNEKFYKKIILTTDQDLIENGVQAIDDEFLEWFVNNPSCDEVEVGYGWIRLTETDNEGYWVSIPDKQFEMQQEEPKQETLEEVADNWVRQPIIGTKRESFIAGYKLAQERMYSAEDMLESFTQGALTDLFNTWNISKENMAKEKFEEWFEQFKNKN